MPDDHVLHVRVQFSVVVDSGQLMVSKSWTVVSFTVERWIVVFLPLKRHRLCTRRRAIISMILLTVISMAFYSFSLFTTSVRYFHGQPVCVTLDRQYNAPLQVTCASFFYMTRAQSRTNLRPYLHLIICALISVV